MNSACKTLTKCASAGLEPGSIFVCEFVPYASGIFKCHVTFLPGWEVRASPRKPTPLFSSFFIAKKGLPTKIAIVFPAQAGRNGGGRTLGRGTTA